MLDIIMRASANCIRSFLRGPCRPKQWPVVAILFLPLSEIANGLRITLTGPALQLPKPLDAGSRSFSEDCFGKRVRLLMVKRFPSELATLLYFRRVSVFLSGCVVAGGTSTLNIFEQLLLSMNIQPIERYRAEA